jgi:hypothetical protein
MKSLILALALIAGPHSLPAAPRGAPDEPTLADLEWLAGHWAGESGGTLTEELWMAPGGGLMLGLNRSVPRSGRAAFEYLRIEESPQGLALLASPGGRAPTAFPLADFGADFVEFANPEHDFPQHLRYERSGDRLSVAAWAGDKRLAWTWTRR